MSGKFRIVTALALASVAVVAGCSSPSEAPSMPAPSPSDEATSPSDSPTQEPTEEESASEDATSEDASQDPAVGGAWTYTDGEKPQALATAAGASLTIINDPVSGLVAQLRAEEFSYDYINDELCESSSSSLGCEDVTATVGATELTLSATFPENTDDPRINLSDPRELWDAIVAEGGTLTLVFTEKSTGSDVLFEFNVDGADPDFF